MRRPCARRAPCWPCVFTTVLFIILAVEQGVDIFPESRSTTKDIRSIRYISLKNAIGHVQDNRDKLAAGTDLPLSENGDYTYFVYEAEKGTGLLTSAGLRRMKDVEEICTAHPDYQDKYCLREYDETDNATWACAKPISVLNMYYASNPNVTLVRSVVDRLAADGAVDSYNAIAFCVEYYYGCDALTAEQTAALSWGSTLSQDIDAIVDTWDGLGELTSEVALTTELAAPRRAPRRSSRSISSSTAGSASITERCSRADRPWGAPLGAESPVDRRGPGTGLRIGGAVMRITEQEVRTVRPAAEGDRREPRQGGELVLLHGRAIWPAFEVPSPTPLPWPRCSSCTSTCASWSAAGSSRPSA